jgi:PhnB protein
MVVSASVPNTEEAKRVFDALAEGGQVNLPLGPTSWAPAFGMLADRFGTPWMVGADH